MEVGEWFHYVNDPIGTPERLLDAGGEVACELRRKAWGETEEAPGGRASTRIRLQGQYEDAETGLFCTRFRYFDPDAGRWISADPIGLDGGGNLYAFDGAPTWALDPYGLAVIYNNGYRTPNGKFASPTGTAPRAGDVAVAAARADLESKGWKHRGDELSFKQPKGRKCKGQTRRYDMVMEDPNGNIVGVEIKSGTATPTPEQRRFDNCVNAERTGMPANR